MTKIKLMLVHFIIINFITVINCSDLYINILKDMQDILHSKWIIVQSCKKIDYFLLKMMKDIKESMNVYANIFDWDDISSSLASGWEININPLILLSCCSCGTDCLYPVNNMTRNLAKFTWLLITDENPLPNITDLHIPIHCLFIVAEKKAPDSFILNEIYRLSPDSSLLSFEIGKWGLQDGLDYTPVPFEERRSDFFGQNITSLVEPDDSLNRLITLYEHYAPSYLSLAKRLNFTIQKTTDPNATHQVSIILDWTDVPRNRVHFQPLHTARQSIYFHDLGFRMQLEGYVKPFLPSIWLAIKLLILLTGFISFVTSYVLSHLTGDKKLSRRLDIHIYKSLYILLQRNDDPDEIYASQRIITISEWIISIYLLSCYSATFVSFISVQIPKPPFTTLDGILESKGFNIVTTKYITSGTLSIEKSNNVKLRRLYFEHFDPVANVLDNALEEFCANPRYLFITSDSHVKKIQTTPKYFHCSISKTHIELSIRHLTWTIERGNQYERILRVFINKLYYGGALQSNLKQKLNDQEIPKPQFKGTHLEQPMFLFSILAIGILTSITIFIAEIIYKHITKDEKQFYTE